MTAAAMPVPAVAADADDVTRAVAGDAEAFERLYRGHVARVTSLARWMLGSDDVDDAVQDVFIRAWQKLGTFQGQAAFGTWLHRLAVNLLLRRRERRAVHAGRHQPADLVLETHAAPPVTPDLRVAIEGAVATLPDRAREVFVLHDMEGYKHEEIAAMLGIDAGTSRSQLHRARLALRDRLRS